MILAISVNAFGALSHYQRLTPTAFLGFLDLSLLHLLALDRKFLRARVRRSGCPLGASIVPGNMGSRSRLCLKPPPPSPRIP